MVEKIIINPEEIRGYGNIMTSHSSSDYDLSGCSIEASTDTVDGAIVPVLVLTPETHTYSIAFSSSSYTASGGSAEVSVTLLEDGVAMSGATVTFTGGTSTVTGTTNSSGVATATVSVTETSTITATYGSATDTCTVTVQTYLFYDECNSSEGLSNYGTARNSRTSTSYSASLTLTDNSYYTVTQSTNNANGHIPITPLTGKEDIKITMETYTPSGGNTGIGLTIWNSTSARLFMGIQDSGKLHRVSLINGQTVDTDITQLNAYSKWIKHEYTIDETNNSFVLKLYEGETLLYTYTDTLKLSIDSNTVYAIGRQWYTGSARIRNIKAEYL